MNSGSLWFKLSEKIEKWRRGRGRRRIGRRRRHNKLQMSWNKVFNFLVNQREWEENCYDFTKWDVSGFKCHRLIHSVPLNSVFIFCFSCHSYSQIIIQKREKEREVKGLKDPSMECFKDVLSEKNAVTLTEILFLNLYCSWTIWSVCLSR